MAKGKRHDKKGNAPRRAALDNQKRAKAASGAVDDDTRLAMALGSLEELYPDQSRDFFDLIKSLAPADALNVMQAMMLTHGHMLLDASVSLRDAVKDGSPANPRIELRRAMKMVTDLQKSGKALATISKAVTAAVKVREQVALDSAPNHVRVTGAVAGRKMLTTPAPEGTVH